LKNIWPSRAQIQTVEKQTVIPAMFQDVYARIENGSNAWQCLQAPDGQLYPWDVSSTYIKNPPFFNGMTKVKSINYKPFYSKQYNSWGTIISCLGITWYSISERSTCTSVSR